MIKQFILYFLFLFIFISSIFSQAYQIKVKVKHAKEGTKFQLGYYYENKQYLVHTIPCNAKGEVIFKGEEALPGGLFFVVIGKTAYFDVIMPNDNQKFKIETDTLDYTKNLKVTGSTENEIFYAYQKEISYYIEILKSLEVDLHFHREGSDSARILNDSVKMMQQKSEKVWKKYVEKYPDSFTATLLTAMNGEPTFAYSSKNFFEHIDFSEPMLIRTNVLHRVCRLILARNLNNNRPVSELQKEIDRVLKKSQANQEVYRYMLMHFLSFSREYQKTGMNELFVHLCEDYVLNGEAPWFDEKARKIVEEQRDNFKASMKGQIAKDIEMQTPDGQLFSLYQIDTDYIFVFFWSTGCGHCEEATEALKKFYAENHSKYSFEVFSVYNKKDKKAWTNFLEKYEVEDWINVYDPENTSDYSLYYYVVSTPILYVLDKDRRIILKSIGDAGIKDVIEFIEKNGF